MSRTLTGAWIETNNINFLNHRFLSHPHGCVNWNFKKEEITKSLAVAPSRVRELKLKFIRMITLPLSRTLTGAWIETYYGNIKKIEKCRTLTGAWIETFYRFFFSYLGWVAPSRVRELKLYQVILYYITVCRTLTGAWIETETDRFVWNNYGRTLTGAWIETK